MNILLCNVILYKTNVYIFKFNISNIVFKACL